MAQEGIEENSSIGPISWSASHVSTTYNEEVMLTAQKLTTSALDRIGILKEVLKEE